MKARLTEGVLPRASMALSLAGICFPLDVSASGRRKSHQGKQAANRLRIALGVAPLQTIQRLTAGCVFFRAQPRPTKNHEISQGGIHNSICSFSYWGTKVVFSWWCSSNRQKGRYQLPNQNPSIAHEPDLACELPQELGCAELEHSA